ncbi:MAG TPA: methyltransferase domain-containing protein [Anaerolineales bacterium]|nr:methyltransferase domain-containing protein [Anaerolineales bacterium]
MKADLYLRVREKEGRLYSDDIVVHLPSIPDGHPLANEWRARSLSASRLTRYLARRPQPLTILDLGCGNGWLSHHLSQIGAQVIGMDVNHFELAQAARVFSSRSNLLFLEGDIFSAPFPPAVFDIIVLASVIQYFPDLNRLLHALLPFLKPDGEIHILDSPLYPSQEEREAAVQRTRRYYSELGFPEMSEQYFHHCLSELNGFSVSRLYHPRSFLARLKRVLRVTDSPFPWLVVRHPQLQISLIAEAFSRTAEKYDAFAEDHPHLTRMRNKVYAQVERFVPKGAHILELNCGTGTDAIELARRGYRIHALDIAPGMLARLEKKVLGFGLQERVTFQQGSFLELHHVRGGPFDAVFSNLGGLNCIPDLSPVIAQLPSLLRPGGTIIWTLMPHICLWEMAEALRGHFKLAFRRWTRGAVRAHLEGLYFDVYYFSPRQVIAWFGEDFETLALEGLSVITPTAENKDLAKKFPALYRLLCWLDDRLAPRYPWHGWGDFFILTLRYQPKHAFSPSHPK